MRIFISILLLFISTLAYAENAPRPMPWVEIGRSFYSPIQVRMWGPTDYNDTLPFTGTYIRINVSDPYPLVNGLGQQCFTIGSNCGALQPGIWYNVDLRPLGVGYEPGTDIWIGADVAYLSGVGIISGGLNQQTAIPDFHITYARADDTTANCSKYLHQVSLGSALPGDGSRSPASTMIPLKDGQYKFCFQRTTNGDWPNNPSYGINLTVEWWAIKK